MTFRATLVKHLMMVASTNMFYVVIDDKNKIYMEVAVSNTNIKIHQLSSKQRKVSGDLKRTCF